MATCHESQSKRSGKSQLLHQICQGLFQVDGWFSYSQQFWWRHIICIVLGGEECGMRNDRYLMVGPTTALSQSAQGQALFECTININGTNCPRGQTHFRRSDHLIKHMQYIADSKSSPFQHSDGTPRIEIFTCMLVC